MSPLVEEPHTVFSPPCGIDSNLLHRRRRSTARCSCRRRQSTSPSCAVVDVVPLVILWVLVLGLAAGAGPPGVVEL